ncbi:hypothetical protein [Roseimaritima sediminicola]|uniref:hypothetical protein n=1 Tax=Roseimaritima sediminicola TaxID=2662066 RepID=UPI0012984B08|nr:hypothetical protein [Roseimaritima sediminicola]
MSFSVASLSRLASPLKHLARELLLAVAVAALLCFGVGAFLAHRYGSLASGVQATFGRSFSAHVLSLDSAPGDTTSAVVRLRNLTARRVGIERITTDCSCRSVSPDRADIDGLGFKDVVFRGEVGGAEAVNLVLELKQGQRVVVPLKF